MDWKLEHFVICLVLSFVEHCGDCCRLGHRPGEGDFDVDPRCEHTATVSAGPITICMGSRQRGSTIRREHRSPARVGVPIEGESARRSPQRRQGSRRRRSWWSVRCRAGETSRADLLLHCEQCDRGPE